MTRTKLVYFTDKEVEVLREIMKERWDQKYPKPEPSEEARRLALDIQEHREWPYWKIAQRIDELCKVKP